MELLKVLFADDEVNIRNGLKYIIDWEECGYKFCGEASNGKDAVAQIINLRPDLIILDIKMPGLTGIEVMEQVRAHYSKNNLEFPAFLILSGFSDFEYAQKSVNSGAKGYLLKPVDEDILQEKVLSIAKEINDHRKLNESSKNAAVFETKDILLNILQKNTVDESNVKKLPFFESYESANYQVVNLCLRKAPELKPADVEKSLNNYFSFFKNVIFALDKSIFAVIKTTNESAVYNCTERASKLNGKNTFICVGNNLKGLEGLVQSYNQARELEKYLFFINERSYLNDDFISSLKNVHQIPVTKDDINRQIESLIFCIETYDKNTLDKIETEIKKQLSDLSRTENEIKKDFIYFIMELKNKLVLKYPEREITDGETEELVSKILEMDSFDDVFSYFKKVVDSLLENFNFNTSESLIVKVIAYVKANYTSDLKLENLGDLFNCNSAYLGKKFKKYTGVQFNTYLDNLRIEDAKDKIINTDLKIYQISKLVGYSNTDYFFMKFKKNTGLTPKEFKMKVENEKE